MALATVRKLSYANLVVLAGLAGVLLIGFGIAFALTRSIIKPVHRVVEGLNDAAGQVASDGTDRKESIPAWTFCDTPNQLGELPQGIRLGQTAKKIDFSDYLSDYAVMHRSQNAYFRFDRFVLMGKVHQGAIGSPLAVDRATYARDAGGANMDVFATATPGPGAPTPVLTVVDAAGVWALDVRGSAITPQAGDIVTVTATSGATATRAVTITP